MEKEGKSKGFKILLDLGRGYGCTNRGSNGPGVMNEKDPGRQVESGSSMDEAKADPLHAMIDFTKEYGVYRRAK